MMFNGTVAIFEQTICKHNKQQ